MKTSQPGWVRDSRGALLNTNTGEAARMMEQRQRDREERMLRERVMVLEAQVAELIELVKKT